MYATLTMAAVLVVGQYGNGYGNPTAPARPYDAQTVSWEIYRQRGEWPTPELTQRVLDELDRRYTRFVYQQRTLNVHDIAAVPGTTAHRLLSLPPRPPRRPHPPIWTGSRWIYPRSSTIPSTLAARLRQQQAQQARQGTSGPDVGEVFNVIATIVGILAVL